jgi:hypothetical protein
VLFDDSTSRSVGHRLAVCAECGRVSGPLWHGWTAYRIDDPETDSEPQIGLFCPACSAREFQHLPRQRPPQSEPEDFFGPADGLASDI